MGRPGGQAGEHRVLPQQADRPRHRMAEVQPVDGVVQLVADVPERYRAADARDDRLRVLEPLAPERHAAERLDAHQPHRPPRLPQRAGQSTGGGARAHRADHRQRAPGQRRGEQLGELPVALVVDLVVVLPHPVEVRPLRQQPAHMAHPQLLVQAQALRGRHRVDRRTEDLQLRPHGGVHGGGGDDVAAQPVAVAGHGERQRVDAAGAVDQGLPGDHPAPAQQRADRAERRVHLHRLEAGEDDVAGQPDQVGGLHRVGDVLVDRRDGRARGSVRPRGARTGVRPGPHLRRPRTISRSERWS